MILLWGVAEDRPIAAVYEALAQWDAPVAFLDQRDVLATTIELTVDAAVKGALQVDDELLDLSLVTAAYIRPYDVRRLPELQAAGSNSAAWRHALLVEDILLSWAELTPALVINRPLAMAVNSSKPYQLQQIRAAGFGVPDTLVTTDPDAVKAFWHRHGGAIVYKSVSGLRSIVSRLYDQHAARLADVAWCPTQFQQYIPGAEYRVHVVGATIFSCEVLSQADDYRYSPDDVPLPAIRACQIPAAVEQRCRRMVATMGLDVAGIDLRRTPEGEWYCLEVNPSPAFTYYQEATEQPLSAAIARLLVGAD